MVQLGVSFGTAIIIGMGARTIWYADDIEQESSISDLNIATNKYVESCLSTLPLGSADCNDNLRLTVNEACDTANGKLDACGNFRVNVYYNASAAATAAFED